MVTDVIDGVVEAEKIDLVPRQKLLMVTDAIDCVVEAEMIDAVQSIND